VIARLAILTALLLAPGVALAQEGGHEGGGLGTLLAHIFNFLLLLGVLIYGLRKPLLQFFGNRRRAIQEDLQRASALLGEAQTRLAEWEGRIARLDAEVASIQAASRERAEAERQRILEEARLAAERIRRDAQAAIEQEARRAREELRHEAAELAVELATKLVREQVTEADRTRLLDEFVGRVQQGAPGAPAAR
jgi:F-type H+-transporting ATPase subunit b